MAQRKISKEQSKLFTLKHKIYMAMIEQDGQRPTIEEGMRMQVLAGEIANRIITEYNQRQDRGLWFNRLIKSGELWEM